MDGTSIIVVIMGALTIIAQLYREGRTRRWATEDRERLEHVASTLATTVKVEAQALAGALAQETQAARQAVVENTEAIQGVKVAADAAYKEANHVNLKIEDLNKRLITQQQALAETTQAPPPQS